MLQITTIGRYGSSAPRSRIPIGYFYGFSLLLPWECDNPLVTHLLTSTNSGSNSSSSSTSSSPTDQSQVLSQLGLFISLLEDIQCKYSLACNQLVQQLDGQCGSDGHTQYYLKRGKKEDDDAR